MLEILIVTVIVALATVQVARRFLPARRSATKACASGCGSCGGCGAFKVDGTMIRK